jgi:hypothetical protein
MILLIGLFLDRRKDYGKSPSEQVGSEDNNR